MGACVSCLTCSMSSIACCFTQQACRLCCSTLPRAKSSTATRIGYTVFMVIGVIMSYLTYPDFVRNWLIKIPAFCPDQENSSLCKNIVSYETIVRIWMSYAIFFFFMLIFTVDVRSSRDIRAYIHNGFWFFKLLIWIGLLVGFAFVPVATDFSYASVIIAYMATCIFLFIQIVLIIDFAYSWNQRWLENHENSNSSMWLGAILSFIILLYLVTLAFVAVIFVFFARVPPTSVVSDNPNNSTVATLRSLSQYHPILFTPKMSRKLSDIHRHMSNKATIIDRGYYFNQGMHDINTSKLKNSIIQFVNETLNTETPTNNNEAVNTDTTSANNVIQAESSHIDVKETSSNKYEGEQVNLCHLEKFIASFNIILAVLVGVLSILPVIQENRENVGLLTASTVTAYATFYSFTGLMSDPSPCSTNHFSSAALSQSFSIISTLISIIMIFYSSVSNTDADKAKLLGIHIDNDGTSTIGGTLPTLSDMAYDNAIGRAAQDVYDDEEEGTTYSYSYFHFMLMSASLYMMLVVSDWYTPAKLKDTGNAGRLASMWIRIGFSWVCYFTYLWTLVAPLVFKDRDFS